jgi:Fe-S cluster biogenesis protein NfuA
METVEERIERALVTVRPFLQADGGDVRLVRFRPDGIVELRWEGTCLICPMSTMTLRAGVERALMKAVPEVRRVEAVAG